MMSIFRTVGVAAILMCNGCVETQAVNRVDGGFSESEPALYTAHDRRSIVDAEIATLVATLEEFESHFRHLASEKDEQARLDVLGRLKEANLVRFDLMSEADWKGLAESEVDRAFSSIRKSILSAREDHEGMFYTDYLDCDVCDKPQNSGQAVVLAAEFDQIISKAGIPFGYKKEAERGSKFAAVVSQKVTRMAFENSAEKLGVFADEYLACEESCDVYEDSVFWDAAGLLSKHSFFNRDVHPKYLAALEKLHVRTGRRELDKYIFADFLAVIGERETQVYGSYLSCGPDGPFFKPSLEDEVESNRIRSELNERSVAEELQYYTDNVCG